MTEAFGEWRRKRGLAMRITIVLDLEAHDILAPLRACVVTLKLLTIRDGLHGFFRPLEKRPRGDPSALATSLDSRRG
jgi:hypothetical protein